MGIFDQYVDTRATDSAASGIHEKVSKRFPSPWLDPASTELPLDMTQVFRFCELLWYANGVYQQAMRRTAAYFVTRVKVEGDISSEDKERWSEFLNETMHINQFMVSVGCNFLAYGNVVMSPRVIIQRLLQCKCGQTAPLNQWKFRFNDLVFRPERGCPKCNSTEALERIDFRDMHRSSVSVRIWNPHTLRIKHNELTGRSVYHYAMPNRIEAQIRKGDPDMLAETPWEFVQCAIKRRPLRLHPEQVFHLKDEPLAGINADGMGLPKGMANFRQAYLTQCYKRLNMVLAMEYSTPMRSVTPTPSSNAQLDPTMGLDLENIGNKLSSLLAEWKRDPAAMHVFPVPLQYTAWGGEGLQMASYQLQDQAMQELLTGLGVPVDFFTGSFKSERTFVPTLRLMERTWEELYTGYNATLNWMADVLSTLLQWPKPKLTMEPTTTANDLEHRQIMLDLWANGRISGARALEPLGINPITENKAMIQEQIKMQNDADLAQLAQQKNTQSMQSMNAPPDQGQGQGQGGQGAPPMPGQGVPTGALQNTPTRPEDILAQAQQIAQQLMQTPEGERHQPLAQLRKDNELLHAAVKREMEKMRSQAGTQAAQQAQGGQK